ncbi:MAG: glycosyltransferase family 2 protein [Cytophagales bacterium]
MSEFQNMDLSIVIINYNTEDLTLNCIESIYKETNSHQFEIIVIDNASKENPQQIAERFPEVKLIFNKENIGFGAANNLGIEKASGKYILLLNSDTIIKDQALDKCVEFMNSDFALSQNIGLMGCKLIYENGEHQNSIFYKNSKLQLLIRSNPFLNALFGKKTQAIKKDHFVSGVSGAFMFFRAVVFDKVKPFDPDIFMYSEETELCRNRVGKHFNIYYWTGASVIHFMGKSSQPEKAYQQNFLSFAFSLYKTSIASYLVFILALFINILSSPLLYPYFMLRKNKYELMRIKGNFVLLDYFLFKIPAMSRKWGSNKKQLRIKYFRQK